MKYSNYFKSVLVAILISLPLSVKANDVTIVLSEELDIVDPCEASHVLQIPLVQAAPVAIEAHTISISATGLLASHAMHE